MRKAKRSGVKAKVLQKRRERTIFTRSVSDSLLVEALLVSSPVPTEAAALSVESGRRRGVEHLHICFEPLFKIVPNNLSVASFHRAHLVYSRGELPMCCAYLIK